MRILQCINALTWGGAQTLLVDLCRFLTAAGHQVRVAAFRDGPLGEALRAAGAEVRVLGEICLDLAGAWRLRRLVADWHPEVIHSHLGKASFWARLLRGRRAADGPALITTVHGFEADGFHRLERRMACRSDHLIFPSRFLAEWYQRALRPLPAHRWSVIPPGAALLASPPVRAPATTERPAAPIIGALARLHPVKGIDTLLEAAGRLRTAGVEFRLVIGGEGRERAALQALAARLDLADRTTWCGSIADRVGFLESLDLLVAPSRQEAFGISICEAMERGVPVVATAVGGIPEIIRDGQDGLLVPSDEPERLAAALRELATRPDRRRQLGEAGRQRILSEFSRAQALDKHLEIYTRRARPPAKRVHLAISSGELGGGERLALSLAAALPARGWQVTFTCGGPRLAARLRAAGATGRTAPMQAGGLFFAARLAADLARLRPTVVSAHLNKAALIAGLLAGPRGPSRCGNRAERGEGAPSLAARAPADVAISAPARSPRVIAHVHGLNRAIYYRWCDRLIAVSAAVRDHLLAQGLPPAQVALLPNCIPGRPVETATRPIGPPWTIAIVAKLHANKGHRWALAALEGALDRLPPFRLWILGDGPERAALAQRFRQGPLAPRLTFWGFQADLDRFYRDIHLVLLPSLGEGIPLSLLEAMRWGIPCVATRVGGIPEIVTAGVNGLLVGPDQSEALVAALAQALVPETWTRLSQGARERFATLNRFDDMLDRFVDLLSGNTGDHRSPAGTAASPDSAQRPTAAPAPMAGSVPPARGGAAVAGPARTTRSVEGSERATPSGDMNPSGPPLVWQG
ncbi:MAG: Glycosyltransferase [Candidatus Ozemobacter sibiricus]|jgi:glycosyltransferase involved in cell wall biosynthesis|uniref:Glycosyltransferase n=1 Tax=Candidatus Ozemobacter sibiricus TaxID=2268124 RepID=A0A367ZMJ4_9BACT|nr:MAG: Glycosyltransferase [Candidatus Ozemobacter sibiricus]